MKKQKNKGITLVALVITIIIIIILATVTINMAFGDNGLITQAELARDMAANSMTAEQEGMNNLMDEYANVMAEDSEISVPDIPKTIEETLKAGDYVYYEDGTGTRRACVVLYDSSSEYGIEIITMESVEDVTLGYDDSTVTGSDNFTKAMNSYNNVINTLNTRATNYNNDIYSDKARCVGSVPNNSSYDAAEMFTSSYSHMSNHNGMLKNTDTNYETDWNQINNLNIENIEDCWLASRVVYSPGASTNFHVRMISDGSLYSDGLCEVHTDGGFSGVAVGYSNTCGLCPIFHLKADLKVTGGSGSSVDPYTLGT